MNFHFRILLLSFVILTNVTGADVARAQLSFNVQASYEDLVKSNGRVQESFWIDAMFASIYDFNRKSLLDRFSSAALDLLPEQIDRRDPGRFEVVFQAQLESVHKKMLALKGKLPPERIQAKARSLQRHPYYFIATKILGEWLVEHSDEYAALAAKQSEESIRISYTLNCGLPCSHTVHLVLEKEHGVLMLKPNTKMLYLAQEWEPLKTMEARETNLKDPLQPISTVWIDRKYGQGYIQYFPSDGQTVTPYVIEGGGTRYHSQPKALVPPETDPLDRFTGLKVTS